MQKIYLLLRNNKQSGPFTRDELLQLSLKNHDLVWIEGKSAGWRNPDEIPELKTEVAVPAAAPVKQEQKDPMIQPVREQTLKPGTSRHVYISLPSGVPASALTEKKITVATAPQTVETNEEPQESFEERVARMQQKVAAYQNKTAAPEEKEAVATKYTRSLDDIREEYANWLHRQKARKNRFAMKPVLAAVAGLAFIILVSFFILKKDAAPDAVLSANTVVPEPVEKSEQPYVPPYEATERDRNNLKQPAQTQKQYTPVTKKKNTAAAKNNTQLKNNTQAAYKTPVKKQASNTATVPVPVAKKNPVAEKETIPLTQLIRVFGDNITAEKRDSGTGLQLTVQNNSRQVLKVVAVDVYYLDSKGKQLQKKTVYFSNLNPNRSLTLTAPGHAKANVVNYKLGLVSTDQGLFYAKQ